MRILLTGSTGYIGRAVYNKLKAYHEIYTVVRDRKNTHEHSVVWDFQNEIPFTLLPKKIEAILHLAQSRCYQNFPKSAMDIFKVNVASTAALLDYALKTGVKHFVLMSSGTVYEPFDELLCEDKLLAPINYYPVSKQASELLTRCYSDKLKTCILRPFFIYGPGQVNRLIPILINRIKNGVPIELKGSKQGMIITPTYVEDVVDIIHDAIEFSWQGIFNLATSEAITIRKVSELIGDFLKTSVSFSEVEQDVSAIEIIPMLGKLKKLYTKPFVPFKEGLYKTLYEDRI